MSEFVGFQFHLVVNSVNLSARVTNMTSNREQEIKEWLASNVGGTTASRRRLPSVQDLKLSVTFKDDFAASGAGSVHNTLEGERWLPCGVGVLGRDCGHHKPCVQHDDDLRRLPDWGRRGRGNGDAGGVHAIDRQRDRRHDPVTSSTLLRPGFLV
jgi:hypothetical protein